MNTAPAHASQPAPAAATPHPPASPARPHTITKLSTPIDDVILAGARTAIRLLRCQTAPLLYALSALCALGGLGLVVGPALHRAAHLRDILPGVAALQGYEWLLLGAALLIVACRAATDDAACLVVLLALFLGASAVSLDLLAADHLPWAAGLGAAALLLAGAKLGLLRRRLVTAPWHGLLPGTVLILAWASLMPAALGFLLHRGTGTGTLRLLWQAAGWLPLLGLGWILYELPGDARPEATTQARPLLPRREMARTFALLVAAWVPLQLRALAYAFDLPDTPTNYLPWLFLFGLALVAALHRAGRSHPLRDGVLLAAPPVIAVLAWAGAGTPRPVAWHDPALLALPIVLLPLAAWLTFGLAGRHGCRHWLRVLPLHVLLLVLLAAPGDWLTVADALNWRAAGALLFAAALVLAVWLDQVAWLYPVHALLLVALLAPAETGLGRLADWLALPAPCLGAFLVGASVVAASFWFVPRYPRWLALAGAAFLAAALAAAPRPWLGVAVPAALLLAWGAWRLREDLPQTLLLAVPVVAAGLLRASRGWGLFLFGVLLLAAGVGVSLRKRPWPAGA